eukprot:4652247-Lingulodinium_polyedra.AAC.1
MAVERDSRQSEEPAAPVVQPEVCARWRSGRPKANELLAGKRIARELAERSLMRLCVQSIGGCE